MIKYKKREFVSLDGYCPMKCKHCYTYDLVKTEQRRTAGEIAEQMKDRNFDILYLSQSNENFYEEDRGLELCSELFRLYQKDIFIITRNYISDDGIQRMGELNRKMNETGNQLYLAVSCFADESYTLSENKEICPRPRERMNNLKHARDNGIHTLLLLRPIFPNNLVPTTECTQLIYDYSDVIDAVISSGLVVTDTILSRLNIQSELKYDSQGDSDYLADIPREKVKYVDVESELNIIQTFCRDIKIPFFRHSMPALNYISAAMA